MREKLHLVALGFSSMFLLLLQENPWTVSPSLHHSFDDRANSPVLLHGMFVQIYEQDTLLAFQQGIATKWCCSLLTSSYLYSKHQIRRRIHLIFQPFPCTNLIESSNFRFLRWCMSHLEALLKFYFFHRTRISSINDQLLASYLETHRPTKQVWAFSFGMDPLTLHSIWNTWTSQRTH